MAFKDKFEKVISYFDTDDVSEVEELADTLPQQEGDRRVSGGSSPVSQDRPARVANQSSTMQRPASLHRQQPTTSGQHDRAYHESGARMMQQRKESKRIPSQAESNAQPLVQPTIALKYPRKYEDATEIVDLLASNECVLIDFQYMLEAQARRCLDFVDGASRVLSGNLQKVGSSMYLLTPQFVVVNIEEIAIPNAGQDVNFDYDMKRR